MFVTSIGTTGWTQNNPISLDSTPDISTNNNVTLNSANNGVYISSTGWYKIRIHAVVTSGGTDIGAQLYANGNAIANTSTVITLATGDDGVIDFEYPVHIVSATSPAQALIQFYALETATPINGYIFIDKME